MGFKEYLEDKISDYINVLDSYINKVEVFNLKSKLEPIKSPTQLEKYKNFFDKYKAKALLLDVDTLVARFTIDYTSKIKRVGSSYKNDKEKILSCLREGDPDANPMGHLNIIKRFQDAYGKPYGSSKKFLQKRIKDLYRIVESWYEFQDLSNEMDVLTSISLFSEEDEKVTKVLEKMRDFAIEWLDNLPYLNDWFEVQVRAYHLEDEGFGDLMDKLKNEKIRDKSGEPISFGDIFEKCFYETWLVDLIESLPPINNFRKSHHLELIDKFSEKDRKSLKKNQVRVQKTLYNLRPNSDLKVESNKILTQKGMIKRELKKKRNIKPLRSIFSEAKELIGILKPCTMMSPLAISNFLDLESFYEFYDVVIFDEASQVTPEDAIGAIMRGKSLVVVGDSNQLPPTTFFKAKISDELRDLDRDVQTMESLL